MIKFQESEQPTQRIQLSKQVTPLMYEESPEISLLFGFDSIWRKRSLMIFYVITRFIVQLKKAAEKYKFKLITLRIHNMIGDKSSDYSYYQSKKLVKSQWTLYQQLKAIISKLLPSYKISVIQPDSALKVLFDCLVLILIIINIFYIPMQLAFDLDSGQDDSVDFFFNALPSWVFLFEIILNFNTAFYQRGMIHDSRIEIFQHYIKGDFVQDLVVVIPFFISQYNLPYINFVLLLRITRIKRIFEQIEEITLIREKFAASIDLIKLLYILILVAHMCGCGWHYLGKQEVQNGQTENWLEYYGYINKEWMVRYQASLYFGTVTAFTIGYGDIVPQSTIEQTYVTFMILITSIVFGYTISSIQTIFYQLREKSDQYRNNMAIVNSYLKKNKISPQLQIKIRKYFDYYFKMSDGPEDLMEKLNSDLLFELKVSLYSPFIKNCDLCKRFDEKTIKQLCKIVEIRKFIPGQSIFNEGQDIKHLYIILNGNVETFINKTPMQIYCKGALGEREFLLNKPILYGAKATQFTEIAVIDFDNFINEIKNTEEGYEEYCLIKDELLYEHLPVQCQICERSHHFLDCPVVFYNPNKVKLVYDARSTQLQTRLTHNRKEQKQRTFQQLQQNIEGAIDAAMDNGLIQDELSEELLKKVGYHQMSQQLEEDRLYNLKSVTHQKTARHLKTYDQIPLEKDDQLSLLYEEFLQFKKEDTQIDSQKIYERYHKNENFNNIVENQVKQKSHRRHRIPRLKTFYKK